MTAAELFPGADLSTLAGRDRAVLAVMHYWDGIPCDVHDLIRATGCSRKRCTAAAARLIRDGLAERVCGRHGQKINPIHYRITAAGCEALNRAVAEAE